MTNKDSGSARLNQLLSQLNVEGRFPIAVLTDSHGLAIAFSANDGMDPERQSAVVAFVQKTALQVTRQLDMGMTEEISLQDANGQHLVCRPFKVKDHELILAVMIPEKNVAYRRVMNSTISEIRQTWKTFWE